MQFRFKFAIANLLEDVGIAGFIKVEGRPTVWAFYCVLDGYLSYFLAARLLVLLDFVSSLTVTIGSFTKH